MVTAPAGQFVKVPEGLSMREASYHVMPRVGLNAIAMTDITEHDRVLVFGQGLIGQFFAQFARGRGATVITVEPEPSRAALSREYVTEHVLNPLEDDVAARVEAITAGRGASVVVEATASPRNIEQASSHLRWEATFVFLSWYSGDIRLNFHHHFHANAVTAVFPTGAGDSETLRAVVDALHRGSIVMGKNLTDDLSFEEACDGYRRIIDGDRSILGMTFDWRGA
jgi:threonine dehydrogenase-like Zn-dependent dehydrogenase